MAVKTGAELAPGDRFKDRGKWYTATAASWVPEFGGKAWESAREIPVGPDTDGYGPPTVLVFVTESYQLDTPGGGIPVTVTTYPGIGKPSVPVTTEIAWRKREYGGWNVVLADNGRLLGWVCPQHDDPRSYAKVTGWSAHVASQAFRGSGPDDEGHVMDNVPSYLYSGSSGGGSGRIAVTAKREEAVYEIVHRLHDKSAPALGYGRHYAVKAYEDPTCPGYGQRWENAGAAGPVCPGCGCEPYRLAMAKPRRRGGRYDGTVGYHLKREGTR